MISAQIIKSLAPHAREEYQEETNAEVNSKYITKNVFLNLDALKKSLKSIRPRDAYEIEVSFTHTEAISRLTRTIPEENFLTSIKKNIHDIVETDNIKIKIKITKNAENNKKSIYSISEIIKFWKSGTAYESLLKIQNLIKDCQELECLDIEHSFQTAKISFTPFFYNALTISETQHDKHVKEQRLKNTNFSGFQELQLIPDDFVLKGESDERIKEFFDLCAVCLSIIHIADLTILTPSNELEVKINGYKNLAKTISKLDDLKAATSSELYEIYSWIYSEAKISDKIGLARNLISIHSTDGDVLKLLPGCLASLHSNYQIYLKDNLKQYIEIKNKLSDSLQKSSEKASDVVKQVGVYFRSSIFPIYTFFFSVFLLRSINKEAVDLKISNSLYLVFLLFVLVSLTTFVYARSEYLSEKERFKNNYESLKSRYKDLISDSDLEKILQKDADHKNDIAFIDQSFKRTKKLWTTLLLSIFVAVTALKLLTK